MKRITIILILIPSLFLATSLKTEEVTRLNRFQLWNDCKPVGLFIIMSSPQEIDKVLPEPARSNIRLERVEVYAAVLSRLQAAGLYSAEPLTSVFSVLIIIVSVIGESFEIETKYKKRLIDPASGESGMVDTWKLLDIPFLVPRKHGRDSGYILYWISEHTDKFIDEYLRVNADACIHR